MMDESKNASPPQAIAEALITLAGKNSTALARVQTDTLRLISSDHRGSAWESRLGPYEAKEGSRPRGLADRTLANKQLRDLSTHGKKLVAAIDALALNVRVQIETDLDELKDQIADLIEEATTASANVTQKGKHGVRNYSARTVEETASKIFTDYTGRLAKMYWDPHQNANRGAYLVFLTAIFSALSIKDSPAGAIKTGMKARKEKKAKAPALR